MEKNSGNLKAMQLNKQDYSRLFSSHKSHIASLAKVQQVLKNLNLKFKAINLASNLDFSPFELVITVGGDGTLLETSRKTKNQKIIAVNSDPAHSVGKLCSTISSGFKKLLLKTLENRGKVKKLNRIQVKINNSLKKDLILNDILFCHSNPAAMSNYRLGFGRVSEEQRSSGLLICTAAGSTGAMKSAGGRAMSPTSMKLQYKPKDLYLGKKRAYILTGGTFDAHIRIKSLMMDGKIFLDGAHVCYPINFGDRLEVVCSSNPLNLIVG
ncbi:hypothetical protein ACFL35_13565 [Candidatus Riflebacteria bacterium]